MKKPGDGATVNEHASADRELKSSGPFTVHPTIPTELVFGLVGGLGTDWDRVCQLISNRLELYGYSHSVISIGSELIPELANNSPPSATGAAASQWKIDSGNAVRKSSGNNAIFALAAVAKIRKLRANPDANGVLARNAYIVRSLKHPDEVAEFRKIYQGGFFVFGVHTPLELRLERLTQTGSGMSESDARDLLSRDRGEGIDHGQHVEDTFHLSDFFLADEGKDDKLRYSIWRCLDLVFGNPRLTPTQNEFAMFMAFAASLRSADMNRQVGAVIARDAEILSTGANDCPRAMGGLYWPVFHGDRIEDEERGRDYLRGRDSNTKARLELAEELADRLCDEHRTRDEVIAQIKKTRMWDVTEYGRSVHAEMEAMLACARNAVSCKGATLYCTTFPCHNCTRHAIAAGIKEIVYIEPYQKSRALELHDDAVTSQAGETLKLRFKPFIGVGPRQFFNLFSMSIGVGRPLSRKDERGEPFPWSAETALPRLPMLPLSYDQHEEAAQKYLESVTGPRRSGDPNHAS